MSQNIVIEYYSIIKNKIAQRQLNSALSSINKLLCNYPSDEMGYYYRGVCEFALNRYPQAIKSYTTAIKINPAFAKAYYNLGISYFMTMQFDLALINIGKALVIFSKQKEQDKKHRCIEALKIIEKERI
jgi:tetratricopeptide (TPR) repeat protein